MQYHDHDLQNYAAWTRTIDRSRATDAQKLMLKFRAWGLYVSPGRHWSIISEFPRVFPGGI